VTCKTGRAFLRIWKVSAAALTRFVLRGQRQPARLDRASVTLDPKP